MDAKHRLISALALVLFIAAASAAGQVAGGGAGFSRMPGELGAGTEILPAEIPPEVELNVYARSSIRAPVAYTAKVEIVNREAGGMLVALRELRVAHKGRELLSRDVQGVALKGVGAELAAYNDMVSAGIGNERIVPAGIGKNEIVSDEIVPAGINKRQNALAEALPALSSGIHTENAEIDPNEIFGNFEPGMEETLTFTVVYERGGKAYEAEKEFTVKVLPPFPSIPVPSEAPAPGAPLDVRGLEPVGSASGLQPVSAIPGVGGGPRPIPGVGGEPQPLSVIPGAGWSYGDLHVHSGYSSMFGGCLLETESWWGKTVPELKADAQAANVQWMSIQDHSYCLDINEWITLEAVCRSGSITGGSFIAFPGIELSADEDCVGGLNAAHLGGGDLTSYIQQSPAEDLWPAFPGQQQAISLVNSQGGLAIANHPMGGFGGAWDWHCTGNMENASGMEIWHKAEYQPATVDLWKAKLRAGEKLYAYSGSDTHTPNTLPDTELGDVVNGVYTTGFTPANVKAALKAGNSFVTNEPALVMWGYSGTFDYVGSLMGGETWIDRGDAVTVKAYYDTVSKAATITLHKGTLGEAEDAEAGWPKMRSVGPSPDWGDELFYDTPGSDVYYRAELVTTDLSYRAFTNPVWFYMNNEAPVMRPVSDAIAYEGDLVKIAIGGAAPQAAYGASLQFPEGTHIASRIDSLKRRIPVIGCGNTLLVNVNVTDADGDQLNVTASGPIGGDLEWKTGTGDSGTYEIQVAAFDGELYASQNFTLTVQPCPPLKLPLRKFKVFEKELYQMPEPDRVPPY